MGFGVVLTVFMVCAHLLGASTTSQLPAPTGGAPGWSEVEGPPYMVVEVPATVSPYSAAVANAGMGLR
jgi:hypothetical protein